ncbi:MAG: thiamine pyrophosphate-binding protein [Candidatus Staskawiczbacteria bacterium]|nr:thiamine pyrophosphate-binding protein [Candidatus Staskawiczbacteria bacterium]
MITVADYVAFFLAKNKIKHVFGMTGGASLHLIHAISRRIDIEMVFTHHEQSAAMCADAYARVSKNLGAAIATSGPGATNLITGICCSFFDSIPVMYITGQVSTSRSKGNTGVRQIGFQETDIVEICKPITKYAKKLLDPANIKEELEKSLHISLSGRQGPVLIDIPDDLQRVKIDPEKLRSYCASDSYDNGPGRISNCELSKCFEFLAKAKRPVVILGWGARLSAADVLVKELLECLNFPVLTTWAAADMLSFSESNLVGNFGTHGSRAGNFTVQNSDLVLVLGSRLDTHATGSPPSSFARDAKKIIIDIDQCEIDKFAKIGIKVDYAYCGSVGNFISDFLSKFDKKTLPDITSWKGLIGAWKAKYPIGALTESGNKVDPYILMKSISRQSKSGDQFVSDTGSALAWAMQAFEFKEDQRFIHAFNNTPMGYALPGAIACALHDPSKRVICIVGDGSMQLNIQELATIAHHKLNIKIFVVNNSGYSMIKQTQDQWLNSNYVGSSHFGGLSMPDFSAIAYAYGIASVKIENNLEVGPVIDSVFNSSGPILCDVCIPEDFRVTPQVKFGYPIEDGEPLLDRAEFISNMLVKPISASLNGFD